MIVKDIVFNLADSIILTCVKQIKKLLYTYIVVLHVQFSSGVVYVKEHNHISVGTSITSTGM